MHHAFYNDISVSTDKRVYMFASYGKRGKILKVVEFNMVDGYYNLALGDETEDGHYDFDVITDNGDLSNVIDSVVNIIIKYTQHFPERTISIYGNSRTHSLLYERVIRNNYLHFIPEFAVE